QYRWFVNIGRPFSNLDGEFAGYLGYCFDITDRKRLEDQLRHVQKMEAVGRLAGGVAHDFNNLLTALTGYLTFVRDTLPSDHAAADDVAQALRATERAAGLTRQLLVFSRRQPADPTVVDLNETIASMEKMLRRLLSERIEVVLALDPALVTVCVDPTHIEQVILNLAVNAGDAMPAGGQLTIETANVTLDAEYARQHVDVAPGEYAMLAVSDTGIGMSDEVKARLFEPFFTTKEPGRGTGLGLATCWAIVRQNGGHIGCYSEQGRGTTFKVYFPRADGAVGPMPLARMEEPVMADRPRTVLLVEDDEAVRVFTARALRQAGYAVLETADGAEALSAARESDGIDLLITDVVMPHIGGEELTARLRARNPELRTLYISGYTANAAAQNGALALAGSFLQKPFTPASLTRKVSEILSDGQS
ncbi:MAG: ATP-binding protein, partial [Anaerolineae bacterium]